MDIEAIKQANPIEDLISESFPLRGTGRYLRAEAHSSLVVDLHNQCYFWNSQDEHGDVITWVEKRERCGFRTAVERLCRRAGLPAPEWHVEDAQAAAAHRARCDALTVAGRHFVRTLRGDVGEPARNYCYSRGWTDDTIQRAGLGFTDGDRKALQGEFAMHGIDTGHPAAQAALGIQAGMLVYPHVEYGRVVYLAARSIEGKRHYNPPVELIGERRLYLNWPYERQSERVVVVEGQADAITLAQWDIPAVALAGVAVNQVVLKLLARHKRIYVALDPDEAGITAARKMADALGPLAYVVEWPAGDANAWLQNGATAEDCTALLADAPTWVEVLAREAGQADNGRRIDQLRRAFSEVARLGEFERAIMRQDLAEKMGLGLRAFNTMLRATEGNEDANSKTDEPVISIRTVGGTVEADGGFYLLETVYQPPTETTGTIAITAGKTAFAIREPDGNVRVASHLDVGNVRYLPPAGDGQVLRKGVVLFAQDMGPLLTSRELIGEIRQTIHRYVDLDGFFEALSAYYVLFTWFNDCYSILPYLRFKGDYGTGKSRALQVIGALCFRPMRASGAASDASLFRTIDTWRGTLLLEEADYQQSDYAQATVKILNQGYDKNQAIILRCADRANGFETEAYDVYGPKMIAMRGEFDDKALASRCLTKEMGGATLRKDIPIQLPRQFWLEEAPRLRGLLLRYRLEHWQPNVEVSQISITAEIEPRLKQVVLVLYSVVKDDELRADLTAFVEDYHRQVIRERQETLEARVLEALIVQIEREKSKPESEQDLSVGRIRDLTNLFVEWENSGGDAKAAAKWLHEHSSTEAYRQGGKGGVSYRGISKILNGPLQLDVDRKSTDPDRRKHVLHDPERLDVLCRRYGIDAEAKVSLLMTVNEVEAFMEEFKEQASRQPAFDL
jgi:DNA primase